MIPESHLSIDAKALHRAQQFYTDAGFTDTPTPWLVEPEAYLATCPPEVVALEREWKAPDGLRHVASAEQGFIHMLLKNQTIPNKAQSTTPCFRWESNFDTYHLPCFYKVELYDASASDAAVENILELAEELFWELGLQPHREPLEDGSIDLVSAKNIELGSYGIRHFQGHGWAYGTGLALPRFSQALHEEA